MKRKVLTVLAGVVAAGAAATAATSVSADIICNTDGDCWHADAPIVLRHGWVRHPDEWYFHRTWVGDPKYHWHEWHEGHGYWRGGIWVPLP